MGMARPPKIPTQLRGMVFRGADAIRAGLLTKESLRSSAWRRLLRGTYVDVRVNVDHGTMCAAAMLIMPASAVIIGRSAMWLLGVVQADLSDPVEIGLSRVDGVRAPAGIRIRQVDVPVTAIVRSGSVRYSAADWTAWDVAHGSDVVESVVALDAMAQRRLVDSARLATCMSTFAPRRWGRRRAELAIELMDGRSESPQESRVRVQMILGGLPRPTPQYKVRHDGRFVARLDFAWPELKVALEYDGEWHNDSYQFRQDRRRLNALTKAGWTVLFATATTDLPTLIKELHDILGRRAAA